MIEDLSGLSDEEFERERQRLILEEIRRSPAHQQKSLNLERWKMPRP